MTYRVRHISVSINRSPNEVYQFSSNPENIPQWIAFIESVTRQGDFWIGKTALGDIKIKWPQRNDFHILDHQVTMTTGETVNNPMRIVANNQGTEFIFTLFWQPGRSEKEFEEDVQAVTKDLHKLKEIMESQQSGSTGGVSHGS
jgi:hypothetical protein